jgi:hypothetical protein
LGDWIGARVANMQHTLHAGGGREGGFEAAALEWRAASQLALVCLVPLPSMGRAANRSLTSAHTHAHRKGSKQVSKQTNNNAPATWDLLN